MLVRRFHLVVLVGSSILLATGCVSSKKKHQIVDGGPSYENLINEVNAKNAEQLKESPFSHVSNEKKKNPFTAAWSKASSVFTPKPKKTGDATSLSNRPDSVPAEVHLTAGRMLENQGRASDAISHYQAGLKSDPKHLATIVSLARLHDREGNFDDAVRVYKQAITAYPKEALLHNDLGLCYARKGDINGSVSSLAEAIKLAPTKKNYRNNMATVLVEAGRVDDAYKYLKGAVDEPVARYNLAYLLNKRNENAAAIRQLELALKADASFGPAKVMLASLGGNVPTSVRDELQSFAVDQQEEVQRQAETAREIVAPIQPRVADEPPRTDLRYSEDDDMPQLLPPVVELK